MLSIVATMDQIQHNKTIDRHNRVNGSNIRANLKP